MKAGLFMGRIRNKGSLYFQRIENSTKVKLPDCKAWVVRMDAINTKDNIEDPFSEEVGKFAYSIKKTAEEFSRIFEGAIVYAESDEISIVFLDKIRIEVQSNLPKSERKYFKHSRHLLLSRRCKIKENRYDELENMLINYSENLRIAYREKECIDGREVTYSIFRTEM